MTLLLLLFINDFIISIIYNYYFLLSVARRLYKQRGCCEPTLNWEIIKDADKRRREIW